MTPEVGVAPAAPRTVALRTGYENLRREVLAHADGASSLGAGLLVSRGMAARMRAWVELVPSRDEAPREASRPSRAPSMAGRGEVVTILAHMALDAR